MDDRYAAYSTLLFDRPAEHVLRIRINRPERLNALTARAHTELTEIWRDVDKDPSVRAVIIGGAIMLATSEIYWIDGILSIGIGALILVFTGARILGIELHAHENGHCHKH